MNRVTTYLIVCLVLCCALVSSASAQTKVQVVTKTVRKSFDFAAGMKLDINGERADIQISTHSGKTVSCVIALIARHPDRAIAEKELNFQKLQAEQRGNTVFLHNYIELPGNKKPSSNLKVVYKIKVPADEKTRLEIANYFGKITLKGFVTDGIIRSEFSPVAAINMQGKLEVDTKYGDIEISDMNARLSIRSNRSNITINGLSGEIDIKAVYANILLNDLKLTGASLVDASRSETTLTLSNTPDYKVALDLEKTDFTIPEGIKLNAKFQEGRKWIGNLGESNSATLLNLKLRIGSFTIQDTPINTTRR